LNDYNIRISFENAAGHRLLYTYNIPHGEKVGNYKLEDMPLAQFVKGS